MNYLVRAMRALGFEAGIDGAGNAVGSLGSGPNEIMLLGHIDTVPGLYHGRAPGRCPVRARRGGRQGSAGHVCGRRGPGRRPARLEADRDRRGGRGEQFAAARAIVRDHYAPAKMVIIGEPSGWDRVTLGYKGSLWLRYQLRQAMAHTAARTVSACDQAVAFWNRLQEFANSWNAGQAKVFDQLTPSLRRHAFGERRFSGHGPSVDQPAPAAGGGHATRSIADLHEMAGAASLEVEDCTPAYRAEKNNELVRAFLAAIRQAGGQPGFVLKTGTSDMNILGPAWGCPIVAYGPGDSNLDHTPEEHILVSEYLKGVEVLTRALTLLMAEKKYEKIKGMGSFGRILRPKLPFLLMKIAPKATKFMLDIRKLAFIMLSMQLAPTCLYAQEGKQEVEQTPTRGLVSVATLVKWKPKPLTTNGEGLFC